MSSRRSGGVIVVVSASMLLRWNIVNTQYMGLSLRYNPYVILSDKQEVYQNHKLGITSTVMGGRGVLEIFAEYIFYDTFPVRNQDGLGLSGVRFVF